MNVVLFVYLRAKHLIFGIWIPALFISFVLFIAAD